MQAQPTSDAVEPAARTSAAADAELLVFAEAMDEFLRAARRARGQLNRTPVVPELSASQFHLLEPLLRSPEALCVGALADAAGVTPPSATRMLDGLVKAGFVDRRPSERDRRCVEVVLTTAGRAAVEQRHELMQTARRQVFAALDPADRPAAERLLRRLAQAAAAIDL